MGGSGFLYLGIKQFQNLTDIIYKWPLIRFLMFNLMVTETGWMDAWWKGLQDSWRSVMQVSKHAIMRCGFRSTFDNKFACQCRDQLCDVTLLMSLLNFAKLSPNSGGTSFIIVSSWMIDLSQLL